MEGQKCTNCGESSIVHDDDQVVCSSCGQVQEDAANFVTDGDYFASTQSCHSGGSYQPTFGKQNYRLANTHPYFQSKLHKWTKYINQLCESMQITSNQMHKEAGEIFKQAFEMDGFKLRQRDYKTAMCASCVYITCRRHDWPITIINLTGVTDIPKELLVRVTKELLQKLKIHLTTVSIEDYVPTCLKDYGVTDDGCLARTLEVIDLAKDLYLDTGRHKDALVLASCCIVWQTSSSANRKKKVTDFERCVLIRRSPWIMRKRYKELVEVLVKMVHKVPWVSKAVLKKKNGWMCFLDDVIRYKKSILSQLQPPEDLDDINLKDIDSNILLMPPAWEASVRNRKYENHRLEHDKGSFEKSGHKTRESLNDPELSEKDIPDCDLGLYIRSDKEVRLVEELAELAEVIQQGQS